MNWELAGDNVSMNLHSSLLGEQGIFETLDPKSVDSSQSQHSAVSAFFPGCESLESRSDRRGSILNEMQPTLGWRRLIDIPSEICEQHGYPHQIVSGEGGFYILFHLKQRQANLFFFSPDFARHELVHESQNLFWVGRDNHRNGLVFVENDMFNMKNNCFEAAHSSMSNGLAFFDPVTRSRRIVFGPEKNITPVCAAAVRGGYVVFDQFSKRLVTVDTNGRERQAFPLGDRYIRSLKALGPDSVVFLSGLKNIYSGSEIVEKVFTADTQGVRLLYSNATSCVNDYSYDVVFSSGCVFHSSIHHFTRINLSGGVIYRARLSGAMGNGMNSFSSIDVHEGKLYGVSMHPSATSASIYEIDCVGGCSQ